MHVILATVAFLLLSPFCWPSEAGAQSAWEVCAGNARAAERLLSLPESLLLAIQRVESGRWNADLGSIVPWPWTIMAENKGRFLPSKRAAVHEVARLRARGARNIDVGCMQINLHYHGGAFESVEQALDPAFNVAYGAKFLTGLQDRHGDWPTAIAHYHSATPGLGGKYFAKVEAAWRAERGPRPRDGTFRPGAAAPF